jgi:hypothetical protein
MDVWDLSLDAAAAVIGADEERKEMDRQRRKNG